MSEENKTEEISDSNDQVDAVSVEGEEKEKVSPDAKKIAKGLKQVADAIQWLALMVFCSGLVQCGGSMIGA